MWYLRPFINIRIKRLYVMDYRNASCMKIDRFMLSICRISWNGIQYLVKFSEMKFWNSEIFNGHALIVNLNGTIKINQNWIINTKTIQRNHQPIYIELYCSLIWFNYPGTFHAPLLSPSITTCYYLFIRCIFFHFYGIFK